MKSVRKAMQLYAVTDRSWLGEKTLYQQVEEALKGGVTCVQLREKDMPYEEFLKEALSIRALCKNYCIPFVINDNVDIAIKCNADGIHVGQSDMNITEIKKIVNSDMIIGVSVVTVEQAMEAEKNGANYLGVGAVFSTSTKTDADTVSYETLKEICNSVSVPVTAIGGISENNIANLKGSGIDGVAVVSAIFASRNIEKSCKNLLVLSKDTVKTKIKGAIFDLDGTLLDSMYIWENLAGDYIRLKGLIPEENIWEIVKPMSLYQSACYIREKYGISDDVEKIMDDINKLVENFYISDVLSKEGVIKFLEKLKSNGVKMCIATATDKYMAEAALKRNGLDGFFDEIFTCTEIGYGKDEPYIFNEALKFLGSEKRNTYVFEDALYAAKTAHIAGFKLCGVYDKSEDKTEELQKISDIYLKSYMEIGDCFD